MKNEHGFGCIGVTVIVVAFLIIFSVVGLWVVSRQKPDPTMASVSNNDITVTIKPKSGPVGTKVSVSISLTTLKSSSGVEIAFFDANNEQALGSKTVEHNSAAQIAHPDWPQRVGEGGNGLSAVTFVIPATVDSSTSVTGAPTALGEGRFVISYANPASPTHTSVFSKTSGSLSVTVPFEVTAK